MVARHRLSDGGLACAVVFLAAAFAPAVAHGRSVDSVPRLPAPAGTVINVSTEPQLQSAVRSLRSNTTIVIAPGRYVLTGTLYINGTFTNVAIRGATDNRDDVVLVGPGMTRSSDGGVPFGIWSGGSVQNLTIANLTIRDLYYHPIIFNPGTQSPRVYNVHLIDAGQQFIKSNPDDRGGGVNDGIVEYSVFEYTTTARDYYTDGVDVHTGANWIIRHNLFRNIVAPPGQLAGPAVLMWNHSSNTVTEGNSFVNCARGISFGLEDKPGFDHSGGIIRNNFFYRGPGQPGDVGIYVGDSPNTQIVNNTVFVSGTYATPIEYRFPDTTGLVVANNLVDGSIWARDGASATERTNLRGAASTLFVNASAGDLHLAATAASAIDRGTVLTSVTDDWDGGVRPYGSAYDIGADEYGAGTAAFGISGRVVDGASGASGPGVPVRLTGARAMTTMTAQDGTFVFSGLAPDGAYTVTPSYLGYAFSPSTAYYAALARNETINFAGFAEPITPGAPAAPGNLRSSVAGRTVTLTWTSPSVGPPPASYIVIAGSMSGASDIATFNTGAPATTLTVASVAAGSYFVRLRAQNDAGQSPPSNEAVVVVVP